MVFQKIDIYKIRNFHEILPDNGNTTLKLYIIFIKIITLILFKITCNTFNILKRFS